MDSRLVLLGTAGGPTPKASRSAPAQAVVVGDRTYLVDAGNGVARQMRLASVAPGSLRAVCVTHHHSDHNVDVGTVVQLCWGANLTATVDVIGPPPMASMMEAFLAYARTDTATRVADEGRPDLRDLVRTREVTEPGVVFSDDRVRITAGRVDHPPMDAWAYRIDAPDRSYVVSGDTAPSDGLVELARGADVLVHEVIDLPSIEGLAQRSNGDRMREHLRDSHTPLEEVGTIAARAQVGTLVLSHFVPGDSDFDDEHWRRGAQQGFSGRVVVGRDLLEI